MGKTHLSKLELKEQGTVTQANAPTISATYTPAEVQAIADLANALKAKLNEICKG